MICKHLTPLLPNSSGDEILKNGFSLPGSIDSAVELSWIRLFRVRQSVIQPSAAWLKHWLNDWLHDFNTSVTERQTERERDKTKRNLLSTGLVSKQVQHPDLGKAEARSHKLHRWSKYLHYPLLLSQKHLQGAVLEAKLLKLELVLYHGMTVSQATI